MCSKRFQSICTVLGLSLFLSACWKVEGTTTVLEDGRIIDRLTVQSKHSMLFLLSVNQLLLSKAKAPTVLSDRGKEKLRGLLNDFSSAANVCTIMAKMFDEKEYLQHTIPFSITPLPSREISTITTNACFVQIGPYDPRELSREFVQDTMGMSITRLPGLYDPYKLSIYNNILMQYTSPVPYAQIEASCEADSMPDVCKREMTIAMNLIKGIVEDDSDEFLEMISNEDMLLGLAEIARLALHNISVILNVPDNVAVYKVGGSGDFKYGKGWEWQGSAMELLAELADPEWSLEVRPARGMMP